MKKKRTMWMLSCLAMILLWACSGKHLKPGVDADEQGHTAPTPETIQANAAVLGDLPFHDQQDFNDARRGFIAGENPLVVKNEAEVVFDQKAYAFIQGPAPASVNPSLWRQAQLNNIHGLFEVTEGIYQLRGFDLANLTLIQGNTGWIVVDPLTTRETAAQALALARRHLGDRSVSAVIFTHSHVDHFGGVLGILTPEETTARHVRIIAPKGFMLEATSENILAGPTMIRRADYMYGRELARSVRGHVDSGLGKQPAMGKVGILNPTDLVDGTPQEMIIDGVTFIFQSVPESEAPAEFTFYLPEKKAFCGAEMVSRQMHNLYTLRGAKVRNALAWSNYIDEALQLFGRAEIYFGTHHWPIWGNERIVTFLKQQRDTYKFIHDQTLRLAHSGYTPLEIADQLQMPASLRGVFSSREYYGTLRHNARAVYQYYYGWFDGNPANLNPLPPVEAAQRYIEYMGGAEAVLSKARASFEKGDYRWVAEIVNKLVFADPANTAARALLASTYDQLGYQSESGPWRDVYLTGAFELRHGGPENGFDLSRSRELLKQAPLERFFDAMATRLNGPKADGVQMTVNFIFTDLAETHVLNIENAVLHHRKGAPDPQADASVKLTHDLYLDMALGSVKIKDALFSDSLSLDGNIIDLVRFFALFDKPEKTFAIVTP